MFICEWVYMYVHVYMWRLKDNFNVILRNAVHFFWGRDSLPGVPHNQSGYTGWLACPGDPQLYLPRAGITNTCYWAWLFMWVLGVELRSLCLQSECFTNGAIPQTLFFPYIYNCTVHSLSILPGENYHWIEKEGKLGFEYRAQKRGRRTQTHSSH